MNWHYITPQKAGLRIDTDLKQGLSEKEAEKRLESFGKNELPQKKPLSRIKLILEQVKSPLIYILLIAGGVVLFFKEYSDAIVIFLAVFLNTIVGYVQESKADQALKKLKEVIKIKAKAIRDNREKIISYTQLVPGDLVVLEAGDKVPADGRIIESEELKINEMALTGEWLPAAKKKDVLPKDTPVPDRDNMVFMGTVVENGRGKFLVTATGSETQTGRVASMVKETKEEKTPLQKKIEGFSKIIGVVVVLLSGLIFIDGVLMGKEFLEMFVTAVAVAVAAIPEGLPVAVTVILAIGMQAVLKKKGLVRRLLAAETLGSTNIICTDKTLSLTEGEMRVDKVISGERLLKGGEDKGKEKIFPLGIAALSNEAFIENPEDPIKKWIVRGRPTDKGLLMGAVKAGVNKKKMEEKMPRIKHLPFNSENKFIASLNQSGKNQEVLNLAGAPEKIMEISSFIELEGKKRKFTSKKREEVKERLDQMASQGLRVVAVAYKKTKGEKKKLEEARDKDKQKEITNICKDLVFVGLVGLKDPLRRGVKEAIKTVRKAGMKLIMVTGDYEITAKAIAKEIGLKTESCNVIKGDDLDKLSEKEFENRIKDIEIYARSEPKHKMRIVKAWQDRGEVVAMTGDGINDAPALKKADIGVALGSGTEVAKEVADLVLLNDNFNVIVIAIEQGRKILDNIRKVITYLLSDSFTETILIAGALLFRFPLPITAVQILWINLIEDGLPNIALSFEPKEKGIMDRKPEGRKKVLTREMKAIIFIIGLTTDLILLGLFFWLWQREHAIDHVRTMIFACLAIDSLFFVFSCKSLSANVWHINPFSNKFLIWSLVAGAVALVAAIYLPPLQSLLETVPLSPWDWVVVSLLGVVNITLIEITKWFFIVKEKRRNDAS